MAACKTYLVAPETKLCETSQANRGDAGGQKHECKLKRKPVSQKKEKEAGHLANLLRNHAVENTRQKGVRRTDKASKKSKNARRGSNGLRGNSRRR